MAGSDRKLKKRRTSSSSSAEDEGQLKRRRNSETKSDRKDESKPHKMHKSRKSSTNRHDKGAKSETKHKHKHKRDRGVIPDFKELSSADYFSKNNEFATWLKEERDVFFSDLSSESAHNLFSKFVKAWNKQKLESRYYEGIVTGPRSSHNWKFKMESKGDVIL